jgi:ribose transport system substrate-binding protein
VPKKTTPRLYLIPILSKALDVLEMLQRERGALSLEVLHQRSRISKTSVYRILQTLVHRGYVSRNASGHYRLVSQPSKMRFGYCAQSFDMPFSETVTASLRAAASSLGIELVVLDNRYDGQVALANADELIQA